MVEFAKQLEQFLSIRDYHVGITGGCLYNGQSNKDIDIIIYNHRYDRISSFYNKDTKILKYLEEFGLEMIEERNHEYNNDDKLVYQFEYNDRRVDIFLLN